MRLWETEEWRPRRALTGHADDAGSVAFAADGRSLVTAGDDATVRLWDVASGALRQVLRWQDTRVLWGAFTPDGATVASAGYVQAADGRFAGQVRLWDAATGTPRRELDVARSDAFFSLLFPPDGRWVVGGTADGRLLVWDAATWLLRQVVAAHGGLVNKLALAPDGRTLASASLDATARLWAASSPGDRGTPSRAGPAAAAAAGPAASPHGAPGRSRGPVARMCPVALAGPARPQSPPARPPSAPPPA